MNQVDLYCLFLAHLHFFSNVEVRIHSEICIGNIGKIIAIGLSRKNIIDHCFLRTKHNLILAVGESSGDTGLDSFAFSSHKILSFLLIIKEIVYRGFILYLFVLTVGVKQ